MPELRARSRTPSRSGQASPSSSSPKKGAAKDTGICGAWGKICPCPKMTAQRKNQLTCVAWIFVALVAAVGGLCAVHHRVTVKLPVSGLPERMAFTFRCLLISGIPVAGLIKLISCKRFTSSSFNPMSGNERIVEVYNRILRNTMEQYMIHCGAMMAVTTYLSADQMKFIPLLTAYFLVGRVFFFFGYPSRREFGFALGMFSSGIAFWYTVYCMATRGIAAF